MKTSVLESLFNKIAGLQARYFIQKKPQQNCFPVSITKMIKEFLRIPFS